MAALNENQQLVRDAVDALKLPQQRFADVCGVSFAAVHAWVNGMRSPTPESLDRIARGLGEYAVTVKRMADKAAAQGR